MSPTLPSQFTGASQSLFPGGAGQHRVLSFLRNAGWVTTGRGEGGGGGGEEGEEEG